LLRTARVLAFAMQRRKRLLYDIYCTHLAVLFINGKVSRRVLALEFVWRPLRQRESAPMNAMVKKVMTCRLVLWDN
jgi:hypothetical protein